MDATTTAAAVGSLRPETFLAHWRTMRDAKEEHADVGMSIARTKKAAKRDGVNMDALAILEKLAKLEADQAKLILTSLFTYARWLDMPFGGMTDMFTGEVTMPKPSAQAEQRLFSAKQDGIAAGTAGHKREVNPHPGGTPHHVQWDKGWLLGFKRNQAAIAGRMRPNGDGNGRAKRGRGAGDQETAH